VQNFEIDDALRKTFDLNVKGTFYGMQAVLPHARERPRVIVNTVSMAHRRGVRHFDPPRGGEGAL
jgi:NAD(P)-dependent dehydrogenase (short-subunit alcohol dehydrogenase family)